jgi:hypothetical protein
MDSRESDLLRRWVDAWRSASRFLEEERRERLRAMTDDDMRKAIVDLLSVPTTDLPERECGLIEQQRLFKCFRHLLK